MRQLVVWKQQIWLQAVVIYTRYLLGGAFVFASLIKIKGHRFTHNGELAPIHSAPHFFETLYQSGLYWQFLGVGQLIAGLLLMTQRYALVGALLFLPIIANVFVITLSYDFAYTYIITGAMLGATIGLLGWDWNILRAVIYQPVLPLATSLFYERKLWEVVGGVLFLYTAVYRALADAYDVIQWFGSCMVVGLLGLGSAWMLHRRTKRETLTNR